jgi:hypothetical protein
MKNSWIINWRTWRLLKDEPVAANVQCWGRSDRSGSSSASSSSLSLFSSLQLDELELELEDELEELELDDHLEGPLLLLLGWRDETLAFPLEVANEKEMPEGGGLPLLIQPDGVNRSS